MRYSESAKRTAMNSVRTITCGDRNGTTRTSGGCSRRFGGSSGTPTARGFPARAAESFSHRAEKLGAQAGDAEDTGTQVGADDRAELRDHLRVAAVDLPRALGEPLGVGGRLDVLDRERV